MALYNNHDIVATLRAFRDKLRTGAVRVSSPAVFRMEVASQFGIGLDDFNTDNFKKSALKRFADLFGYPQGTTTPKPDDFAWAVQNFLNRRAEPWKFYYDRVLNV